MTQTEPVNGAEFLARSLAANGTTHVWCIDAVLRRSLIERETPRRRGIAAALVVDDNAGFGQGWPDIQRQPGNRPGDGAEPARLGPGDVARVFGLRGGRVADPSRLAWRDAPAPEETVAVATDIDCRAPGPWLPEGV